MLKDYATSCYLMVFKCQLSLIGYTYRSCLSPGPSYLLRIRWYGFLQIGPWSILEHLIKRYVDLFFKILRKWIAKFIVANGIETYRKRIYVFVIDYAIWKQCEDHTMKSPMMRLHTSRATFVCVLCKSHTF